MKGGDESMIEIKSITGETIYIDSKATSIKQAVVNAVNQGVSLAYADLKNANLSDMIIRRGSIVTSKHNFTRPELGDFEGADLSNADLSNAALRYVDFDKAILTNANFTNTNLRDCYFDEVVGIETATFINANLHSAIADFETLKMLATKHKGWFVEPIDTDGYFELLPTCEAYFDDVWYF